MEFDRVDCFGMISVRIPRTWVEIEGEAEDTQGFRDPAGNSGNLRVTLFSNKREKPFTVEMLQEEDFADRDEHGVKFFRQDNRVIAEWDRPSKDDGAHMYFWTVTAALTPTLSRRALFSYAVPRDLERQPGFREDYEMVRGCVLAIHFMAEKTN